MSKGPTLLITGGTGSFGNAVLHGFLNTDIKEIRFFSRDEEKHYDMGQELNNPKVKFYIGDGRDLRSVEASMYGVDCVFHVAELKQVPACEFYPLEAVKTNVRGAARLLDAAHRAGVRKVICLSTDKAVNPINAMGLSKALMEKLMVAKSREANGGRAMCCATRYGNVMGSRGSVIPLFMEQIIAGGTLTVTDPQMTRFMRSLDQAVDLVLFACQHGRPATFSVTTSRRGLLSTPVMWRRRTTGRPGRAASPVRSTSPAACVSPSIAWPCCWARRAAWIRRLTTARRARGTYATAWPTSRRRGRHLATRPVVGLEVGLAEYTAWSGQEGI